MSAKRTCLGCDGVGYWPGAMIERHGIKGNWYSERVTCLACLGSGVVTAAMTWRTGTVDLQQWLANQSEGLHPGLSR